MTATVNKRKMSGKKIIFSLIPLLGVFVLGGLSEVGIRNLPIDRDFAQFLFFTEFKVDRWRYLSANWTIHQLDVVMENPSYDHYMEPPEPNRPPFDHVPYAFEVKTNKVGFRDNDFDFIANEKRVMVLGDSVAFGKGVTFEERFSSLIDQSIDQVQVMNLGLQGCTAECMTRLWNQYAPKLQPDLLIVQASGNDVDQALWQEAMSDRLPGLGHTALGLSKKSFLLQRILFWRGADRVREQLSIAQDITLETHRVHIESLFSSANALKVPVIVLNLPYAYEHFYGGHIAEVCQEYPKICYSEVKVDLSVSETAELSLADSNHEYSDFVTRTADQMPISEETLSQVFPFRDCFHDVVHLSPLGHAIVAEQLIPEIRSVFQLTDSR